MPVLIKQSFNIMEGWLPHVVIFFFASSGAINTLVFLSYRNVNIRSLPNADSRLNSSDSDNNVSTHLSMVQKPSEAFNNSNDRMLERALDDV